MTGAPLSGLRVLDFSELLPGPFLTQSLVEMGADVLKIERPGTGDAARHLSPHVFAAVNRGKRSQVIDLKTQAGRAEATDLAGQSDVLIESYRPGVMTRLGLGPDDLCAAYPGLIYLSISGFGSTGPLSRREGRDVDFLAQSGMASLMKGGRPQLPIGDLGGALYGLSAVLAALVQRGTTGQGQWIDLSLTDCLQHWTNARRPEGQGAVPAGYGVFQCKDGEIALSALSDTSWARLMEVLELSGRDLALPQRITDADALNAGITAVLVGRFSADITEALEATGGAHPVLTPREAAESDHATARGLMANTQAGPLVRFPVRLRGLTETPTAAPALIAAERQVELRGERE